GAGIENAVGVDVERALSPVTLYLPNKKAANFNSTEGLNSYNVTPSGTFMVQQDFDNKYVFTNLPFLKYMLDMKPDECSSIEIKINPGENSTSISKALQAKLGKAYTIQTLYEQNQSLFTAI